MNFLYWNASCFPHKSFCVLTSDVKWLLLPNNIQYMQIPKCHRTSGSFSVITLQTNPLLHSFSGQLPTGFNLQFHTLQCRCLIAHSFWSFLLLCLIYIYKQSSFTYYYSTRIIFSNHGNRVYLFKHRIGIKLL